MPPRHTIDAKMRGFRSWSFQTSREAREVQVPWQPPRQHSFFLPLRSVAMELPPESAKTPPREPPLLRQVAGPSFSGRTATPRPAPTRRPGTLGHAPHIASAGGHAKQAANHCAQRERTSRPPQHNRPGVLTEASARCSATRSGTISGRIIAYSATGLSWAPPISGIIPEISLKCWCRVQKV